MIMISNNRRNENIMDPPQSNEDCTTPATKKVRFGSATLICTVENKEMVRSWWSRDDIKAMTKNRRETIKHLQNIGKDIANITDASDYMGLELYLSKSIERECESHKQQFIKSVINEQLRCNGIELSQFARRKSHKSVIRAHEIGKFHANRSFDEIKLESTLVPSKIYFSGSQSVCSCPHIKEEARAIKRSSSS